MFGNNQLQILLKSLENSINQLENNLENHLEYLSLDEKKEMLKELEDYKNMKIKTEWMMANKEIEKFLD
ncbi:hypothetical protein [Tepidibacter hydrothermalis]|uniref:Uncharacterized protein n=1 Tax=Tepidibacter hydrothermalis TaxID=3036126 RepID=A0ABY8EKD4_9FIRM|nr:hypothetical protein [Tepidibacter hydrothermalis]WFD12439.1 hypothetical protein P4S50_19870 [Tepidibacter hydrothermalis]